MQTKEPPGGAAPSSSSRLCQGRGGSVLAAAQQAAEDVAQTPGVAAGTPAAREAAEDAAQAAPAARPAAEHAAEDVAEAASAAPGGLGPLRVAAGERLGEEGEHERRQHRQRLGDERRVEPATGGAERVDDLVLVVAEDVADDLGA